MKKRPKFLFLMPFILVTLAAALVAPAPAISGEAADGIWGVNVHSLNISRFFDNQGDQWDLRNTIGPMKEAGVGWVRETVFAYASPRHPFVSGPKSSPQIVDQIAKNRAFVDDNLKLYDDSSINVLLVIYASPQSTTDGKTYNSDFFRWVTDLTSRHHSVKAIELHNEPDLSSFWKTKPDEISAEEYVDTYRPFAAAIKASQPNLQIVVGSISNLSWPHSIQWLQRALDHGLLDFADGVSVHPYNDAFGPEMDPFFKEPTTPGLTNFETSVNAFWTMIASHHTSGRPLTLWFTEMGYSSAPTTPKTLAALGSEDLKADYAGRMLLQDLDIRLRGTPLKAVFWYDLKDDGSDDAKETHHFGLLGFDGVQRNPAYATFKDIAHTFANVGDFVMLPEGDVTATFDGPADDLFVRAWQAKDGTIYVPFWSDGETSADRPVSITITAKAGSHVFLHVAGADEETQLPAEITDGKVVVSVTAKSRASWLIIR